MRGRAQGWLGYWHEKYHQGSPPNTDTASPFTSTPSPAGQWLSHSDSTGPTKPEFSRTERGHRTEGSRLHYVLGFAWDFPGVKILCRLYKTHLESLDETCIRMHTHTHKERQTKRRESSEAQELCESRGGRPTVSVDVTQHFNQQERERDGHTR